MLPFSVRSFSLLRREAEAMRGPMAEDANEVSPGARHAGGG